MTQNHLFTFRTKNINNVFKGAIIVLLAAFIWGVGNAVTGFTAHKYRSSDSLFPAIDIALANTLGGLLFLTVALLFKNKSHRHYVSDEKQQNVAHFDEQSLLSGSLKGANTCLYVFSTTYIVATQSLVLESTYIVWSLVLSFAFITRRIHWMSTISRTALLSLSVILVSGETSLQISSDKNLLGFLFGLCAGLSYALFLFFWSQVTKKLTNLDSQLISTRLLLIISSATIILLTELISIISKFKIWIPFTYIKFQDVALQMINGVFVVGIVYLFVTIGMTKLKDAREGASFIAAFCLSFSIPFTLLPEYLLGKFVPAILQIIGIILFMVGFVLMSVNLSSHQQNVEG